MQKKKIKLKKCKVCTGEFKPFNTTQIVCDYVCATAYAKLKEKQAKEKANRKAVRELRANDKSFRLAQAQKWFNKFIRLRDADEPCISCSRITVEWTPGGQWDCGHYLSVGAFPELRFEESNAYKQCKKCNGGSGRFAKKNNTVSKAYRERLILKIGIETVDWLEGPHEPKKYIVEDYLKIEKHYKRKCKELESCLTQTC